MFENLAARESAEGRGGPDHTAALFATWPDIRFTTRRLYVRDGLVVQQWLTCA